MTPTPRPFEAPDTRALPAGALPTRTGIPVNFDTGLVENQEGVPVLTVRPVRAAFGPAVSLVSVDSQGHLWMRLSTAIIIMLAGSALTMVPMLALWWVGAGMVDSGQISLEDPYGSGGTGTSQSPTELPLADPKKKK